MPGAYCFDVPTTSGQALNAGIFRPPASPSASSSMYNLGKSTGSLYSDVPGANTPLSGAKRKRTRADIQRESTPLAEWNTNMDSAADAREHSRPDGAAEQMRYVLAGQMDTPDAYLPSSANGVMGDSVYSDVDYRRELGPKREVDFLRPPDANLAAGFSEGLPSAARSPGSGGWSSLAINTIGEVVGKVWEFCKTGGFRGFHAGGGRGYEFDARITTEPSQGGTRWCNEHDIPTLQTDEPGYTGTPVPGHFPQSDFMPYIADCHEVTTPEMTPVPSAKRRHLNEPTDLSETNDELRRNWVLINESSPRLPDQRRKRAPPTSSTTTHRPSVNRPTPSRSQQPSYLAATSASSGRRISVPVSRLGGSGSATTTPTRNPAGRRSSLRISHAGSPSLNARSTASFAQPRSPPIVRASTPTMTNMSPSRIPVLSSHPSGLGPNPFAASVAVGSGSASSRPSSRLSSPTARAAPSHRRNRSSVSASAVASAGIGGGAPAAAMMGPAGLEAGVDASPRLDAEAKHLAQKKMAAERDADVRMEAFNKRLMAMIRQGKEALGTTVEVEMDGGGGWEDEET